MSALFLILCVKSSTFHACETKPLKAIIRSCVHYQVEKCKISTFSARMYLCRFYVLLVLMAYVFSKKTLITK